MGRFASSDARKYQIVDLQERHHQILRMLVLGHEPKFIADTLNCTTATVGNVMHSELGRRQLSVMRGAADAQAVDIAAEIKRLAPVALARLEEILTTPDVDLKLVANVSESVLDRAGYGAPKIIQGQFTHAHLTKQDIEDMKKRAEGLTIHSVTNQAEIEVEIME
jgi:hypothetical protein